MFDVRERLFTREQATDLVHRMIRKDTPNHIIRESLLDRGLFIDEANSIIRDVRQSHLETDNRYYKHSQALEIGLAVITIILLITFLFLLIAPVQ